MLSAYLYNKLIELLEENENANYMEIGSFDGEGIAMLCKLFPKRKFYSIDPFIEDGNTMQITHVPAGKIIYNVKVEFLKNTLNCENLTHYEMTSKQFIECYPKGLPDIGILLIDGDHSYEAVCIDLKLAYNLADKNKLIVLMDDIWKVGVRQAFDEFNLNKTLKIIELPGEDAFYFSLP